MPFTFAHPAAVVPLRRLRFLQTIPLIVGSMMPDVPYFLPPSLGKALPETHTLYGSLVTCLPLGMAFLVAVLLLREPLTVLLSSNARWLCVRSIERFEGRPMRWPIALLSVLIGTWTHIAWDSFTHSGGWTAQRVWVLNMSVSLFGLWEVQICHLLQYISTIFGLLVLIMWLRRQLAEAPGASRDFGRGAARWGLLAGIGLAAVAVGVFQAVMLWDSASWYRLGFLLSTRIVGWFILMYLAAGLFVTLNRGSVPEPTG